MAVNVSEKLERFAIGYKREHFEGGKTMQGDSESRGGDEKILVMRAGRAE